MKNKDSNDPETLTARERESDKDRGRESENEKERTKGSERWVPWETDVATNISFKY